MSDFSEKKNSDLTEMLNTPEERKKQDNGAASIGAGYASAQNTQVATKEAALKYAKPDKYNRALYDNDTAKRM